MGLNFLRQGERKQPFQVERWKIFDISRVDKPQPAENLFVYVVIYYRFLVDEANDQNQKSCLIGQLFVSKRLLALTPIRSLIMLFGLSPLWGDYRSHMSI